MPPAEAEKILEHATEVARRNAAGKPQRLAASSAGVAFAADEEIDRRGRAEEERQRAATVDRLRAAANVPRRYAAADLSDLRMVPADSAAAYAAVVELVRGLLRRPDLVGLVGRRGPGKTWIACGLVRQFVETARSAVYLDVMDYFIALKKTYGDRAAADEDQVENRYLKPELLVLDEMHERGDAAWEDRMLTRLINKRYAAVKPTLLVSNDTPEVFLQRVGPSIADRIRDGGGVIRCEWPSLRGRIGGAG